MGFLSRIQKLRNTPPTFIFGRFMTVRKGYSFLRKLTDRRLEVRSTHPTLYQGLDVEAFVREMRRDSYTMLPTLGSDVIDEIMEFSKTSRIRGPGDIGEFFYSDVKAGRLPDGRPVAVAHVVDWDQCKAVVSLRNDPILSEISHRYLGYIPKKLDVNLYWSFHVNMTESERRSQNQTIDFHFDVHDYNFSYYHMYITNTTAANGAHVLVRGSHRRKPLTWLFGSVRQTDEKIASWYPAGDIRTLEGPGGTAFFEDTSCYHKAIPPAAGERLLLQIRYH